jgi:hypothetical protein
MAGSLPPSRCVPLSRLYRFVAVAGVCSVRGGDVAVSNTSRGVPAQPYIDMEEFQPHAITRASSACTAICQWVRAMHQYFLIKRAVEPKRQAAAAAQELYQVCRCVRRARGAGRGGAWLTCAHAGVNGEVQKTVDALSQTKQKLRDADARLVVLSERYEKLQGEEAVLEARLDQCRLRADNAAKLTSGLIGEAERWATRLQAVRLSQRRLVGDTLMCVATACYAAPFEPHTREQLRLSWHSMLQSAGVECAPSAECRLSQVLGDPIRLRQWRLCGLPHDVASEENASMLFDAKVAAPRLRRFDAAATASPSRDGRTVIPMAPMTPMCPLIIDPQGQAVKYVPTHAGRCVLLVSSPQ